MLNYKKDFNQWETKINEKKNVNHTWQAASSCRLVSALIYILNV